MGKASSRTLPLRARRVGATHAPTPRARWRDRVWVCRRSFTSWPIFLPRCERRVGRWMRCARAVRAGKGHPRSWVLPGVHGASFGRSRPIGREGRRGGAERRFAPVGGPHAVFMCDRSVPGGLLGGPRRLDRPEGHRGRSARRFLSAGATGATGGATFLPLGA